MPLIVAIQDKLLKGLLSPFITHKIAVENLRRYLLRYETFVIGSSTDHFALD
jgi:hypothetical protein